MKAFQELEYGISTPPNAPQTPLQGKEPSPSDWVTLCHEHWFESRGELFSVPDTPLHTWYIQLDTPVHLSALTPKLSWSRTTYYSALIERPLDDTC